MARDKGIHTPEFEQKLRRKQRVKTIVISAVLIVFVVLPIYLSRIPRFHIRNIEISGNVVTSNESVAQIVNNNLEGSYLWLFPRKNFLIFPKGKMEKDLLHSIPRLSSVEVSLVNHNSIKISVVERKPTALYCENVLNIQMPEGCYFLDNEGFVFSEAPSFSGDVYFIYSLKEPITDPLGKNLLPEENFKQLPEYIKSLESLGVHGRALFIDNEDYHLVLPNKGEIIWHREDELLHIKDNLQAFLKSNIDKDLDFLNKILYIDLRFENKVFFKFQNE